MNISFFFTACILAIFVLCSDVYCQKYERERGIKPSEVPLQSLQFLKQALPSADDIDWYEETSQEGRSFEAKFDYADKEYSIEFDSTGVILDVEIEFDADKASSNEKTVISTALSTIFSSYEIEKSQRQYKDSPDKLLLFLQNKNVLRPRYELVVAGVKNGEKGLYQVVLEDSGQVIEVLLIIPAKTSHLDF